MPGTPYSWITALIRASRPSGGAAVASVAKARPMARPATRRCWGMAAMWISLERSVENGRGAGRMPPQPPGPEGDERQHVHGEDQPGQRAIAVGDERDQAEAIGDDDRTDQQDGGDAETTRGRERAA